MTDHNRFNDYEVAHENEFNCDNSGLEEISKLDFGDISCNDVFDLVDEYAEVLINSKLNKDEMTGLLLEFVDDVLGLKNK